ncbi:hypothetical protein EVAR_88077_1 [Eumeta japonica]|uniref:Uncharacterized protein n=1 Tax=Eumeta variegata TaxID=151549 RepID=A0A4C1WI97_EUMVA|nr:hypothetical protein EVAR_88077_1 [Eumeta japonica]
MPSSLYGANRPELLEFTMAACRCVLAAPATDHVFYSCRILMRILRTSELIRITTLVPWQTCVGASIRETKETSPGFILINCDNITIRFAVVVQNCHHPRDIHAYILCWFVEVQSFSFRV